ncbi:hypothetical protein QBC38DRAFT_4763 [Podospora fimiseda]|uniref:Uncharacterized protein n=1 Tax=Podospora fimiseda TaxID=252190 RepID=A0AAN7BZY1_9PEZI|nr:hypothetical protein QBC38DRAFT_4763 [Podospora fimiseda]
MDVRLPPSEGRSFEQSSKLCEMPQQSKDFPSSERPHGRNPSTFRPPGKTPSSAAGDTAELHIEENHGVVDSEAMLSPKQASDLMSPSPCSPNTNRSDRSLKPRSQDAQTTRSNRGTPTKSLGQYNSRQRRKSGWRRRFRQQQHSEFEKTMSVSLIAISKKHAFTAGICTEVERSLMPLSTARTMGLRVQCLPDPVAPFHSPWGIVKPKLYTQVAVEQVVEGDVRVDVGAVVVVNDETFPDQKKGIILGRAFLEGDFGRHLPQPNMAHFGHAQNHSQGTPISQGTSTFGGYDPRSGGYGLLTPDTPMYMRNQGAPSLAWSPQPPVYTGTYPFPAVSYQTPPQSAQSLGHLSQPQDTFSPSPSSPVLQFGPSPVNAEFLQGGFDPMFAPGGMNSGDPWPYN